MPRQTANHRLANLILGRPLAEFVAERRADDASWARIAKDLREATDGAVDVSRESLREWFMDEEVGAA